MMNFAFLAISQRSKIFNDQSTRVWLSFVPRFSLLTIFLFQSSQDHHHPPHSLFVLDTFVSSHPCLLWMTSPRKSYSFFWSCRQHFYLLSDYRRLCVASDQSPNAPLLRLHPMLIRSMHLLTDYAHGFTFVTQKLFFLVHFGNLYSSVVTFETIDPSFINVSPTLLLTSVKLSLGRLSNWESPPRFGFSCQETWRHWFWLAKGYS